MWWAWLVLGVARVHIQAELSYFDLKPRRQLQLQHKPYIARVPISVEWVSWWGRVGWVEKEGKIASFSTPHPPAHSREPIQIMWTMETGFTSFAGG